MEKVLLGFYFPGPRTTASGARTMFEQPLTPEVRSEEGVVNYVTSPIALS